MNKGAHKFVKNMLLMFFTTVVASQAMAQSSSFDVVSYDAEITPDFANKSVRGKVSAVFNSLANNLREIELNAGSLEIDSVKEGLSDLPFEKKDSLLKIRFSSPLKINEKHKIEIVYHGVPKYGIQFFPEQNQVYTVFSTSQWMPCVDSPDDRATFRLELNFPQDDLKTVGNGRSKTKLLSPKNKS